MTFRIQRVLVVCALTVSLIVPLCAQRRLASMERRFPGGWCPMSAESLGSLGIRFVADASRITFTFSFRNRAAFQQSIGIDNIVILRLDRVPDLSRYAFPVSQIESQLGHECNPNGSTLNLVRLAAEIPQAVSFRDIFPDGACSDTPARQCWNFPSGVAFLANETAPDNPGSSSLRFDTGSLELTTQAGGMAQTRVSLRGFEPFQEYLLAGWLSANSETPDFSLEIFAEPVFERPDNDFCPDAKAVSQTPFMDIVNIVGASGGSGGGEAAPSCGSSQRTVWYQYTAPSNGFLTVDTAGSDFNTRLAAYQGSSCLGQQERACGDEPAGNRALLKLPVAAGQSYRLLAGGVGDESGNLAIRFTFQPSYRTYFPQLAIGGPISTTLSLMATSTSAATAGVLSLFDDDGAPLQANSGGMTASQFPVDLAGSGSSFLTLQGGGQPVAGWGVVESDRPLDGVATFRIVANGALQSVAGVLGTSLLRAARLPVEDAAGTGLALANPGDAPILVRLTPLARAGAPAAASADVTLDPGQHIAQFIPELFPGNLMFQGTLIVEVVGPGAVIVTGLVIDRGLITAIPTVRIR